MPSGPQYYAIASPLITLAAAAGTRQQFPIQIENAWDFIWLDGSYSCDFAAVQAGTDVIFGGFLINVLPSAGQEKLFAAQVPISHAFGLAAGVAAGPRRNTFWGRFDAGSIINLDVTNLTGAIANLRVTFFGLRIPAGSRYPLPGVAGVALPA